MESDEHFWVVARYVERNALRADLVLRAEEWRWPSLWQRCHPTGEERSLLAAWPIDMPANWLERVNQTDNAQELEALSECATRPPPWPAGMAEGNRETFGPRVGLSSHRSPAKGGPKSKCLARVKIAQTSAGPPSSDLSRFPLPLSAPPVFRSRAEQKHRRAIHLRTSGGPGECGTGSLSIIDVDHLCLFSHLSHIDQYCLLDQHGFRDEYGLIGHLLPTLTRSTTLTSLMTGTSTVALTTVVFGTFTVSLTILDFDGVMVSTTVPLALLGPIPKCGHVALVLDCCYVDICVIFSSSGSLRMRSISQFSRAREPDSRRPTTRLRL